MIPLLLLLIFGSISIFNALYTRSVVTYALQEGLRTAQNDPRLLEDIFNLDPNKPEDMHKIHSFKVARQQLVDRTFELMESRSIGKLHLETAKFDEPVADSNLKLAFLPPNFSAHIKGWGRDIQNSYKCNKKSILVPSELNPEIKAERTICDLTGLSYTDQISRHPTELRALVNMHYPILGSLKSEISTKAYMIPIPVNLTRDDGDDEKHASQIDLSASVFEISFHQLTQDDNFRNWFSGEPNGSSLLFPKDFRFFQHVKSVGFSCSWETATRLCRYFMGGPNITFKCDRPFGGDSDNNNKLYFWDHQVMRWRMNSSNDYDSKDIRELKCIGMKGILRGNNFLKKSKNPPMQGWKNSKVYDSYTGQ